MTVTLAAVQALLVDRNRTGSHRIKLSLIRASDSPATYGTLQMCFD